MKNKKNKKSLKWAAKWVAHTYGCQYEFYDYEYQLELYDFVLSDEDREKFTFELFKQLKRIRVFLRLKEDEV